MPLPSPGPPTGSPVASAVAPSWPELDPAILEGIAQLHKSWAQQLDDAADTSDAVYQPKIAELIQGQAGDGLLTALQQIVYVWRFDADQHKSAAAAASHAADQLRGLQTELTGIIIGYETEYDWAMVRGDHKTAIGAVRDAGNQAKVVANSAAGGLTHALFGKFLDAMFTKSGGGLPHLHFPPNSVPTRY